MIGLVRKLRHETTRSLKEGEPSSASKIVKISYQQILNCYCLDIESLLFDLSSDFEFYLELQNFISSDIGLVGKLRHEATSSLRKENLVLPLRQSKLLINKPYLLPYKVCHDPISIGDPYLEFYSSKLSKTNFLSQLTSKNTITMRKLDPNSLILLLEFSPKVRRRICPDSLTFPFTHNIHNLTFSLLSQPLAISHIV